MVKLLNILLLLILVNITACKSAEVGGDSTPEKEAKSEKQGPAPDQGPSLGSTHKNWGNLLTVYQYKNIYLSAAPDSDALTKLKKEGVQVVIDLRESKESRGAKESIEKQGMKFYSFPVAKGTLASKKTVQDISDVVNNKQKVLVFCATGQRAYGWIGAHLLLQGEVTEDTAISISKEAGLTSPAIESQLQRRISETPEPKPPLEQ